MYTVRLYKNSGYDADNIPDSPAALNLVPYIDVSSIDTLQERFLTSIRVSATWSQVEDVDYCRIGANWYYAVVGIRMVATDSAELTLVTDWLLSAGGAANIVYVDGVTDRVHVATADDTYGAFTEEDPLLNPAKAMELDTVNVTPGASADEIALCEATVDVYNTGDDTQINATEYSTPLGTASCTVPNFVPLTQETEHDYGGKIRTGTFSLSVQNATIKQQLNNGIDRARGLGVESSIVAMYEVPETYLDAGDITRCHNQAFQPTLKGNTIETTVMALPYDNANNPKNKRLSYSDLTKYGILTMAGNKCEFAPYQIYHSGDTEPKMILTSDVRAEGCPYFRFRYFLGEDGLSNANKPTEAFWRNCLAGAPWRQVPLLFSQKSGNALDRLQYETENTLSRNRAVMNSVAGVAQGINTAFSGVRAGAEAGGAAGAVAGGIVGGLAGAGQAIGGAIGSYTDYQYGKFERGVDFGISQVKAPDLNFPYNGNIMRDALGNGCIVYRYRYSSEDIARIDKLLTMYGYRVTKALEATDFTNRPYFNYVRADNVRATGKSGTALPKWFNDGIAAQLSRGVRVWHVAPNPAIYNTGNV